MKSKVPLKTYQQRRKARATTSARIESMEQTIRDLSLMQERRRAYDFAAIRAAIKAVDEVSICFVHRRQKLSLSFTSAVRR